MIVLLLVQNEKEQAEKVLNHLNYLMNNHGEDFKVIIVDNNSTDDLYSWAKIHDISYVKSTSEKSWGKHIKMTFDYLSIDPEETVVFMQSYVYPIPGCFDKMEELLVDDCVMSTCLTTTTSLILDKAILKDITNLKSAIKFAEAHKDDTPYRSKVPNSNIFMIKYKHLKDIEINENLQSIGGFALSLSLQLTEKEYKIKMARNTIAIEESEDGKIFNAKLDKRNADEKLIKDKYKVHYMTSANQFLEKVLDADQDAEFTILDVGCDSGATLIDIKNRHPKCFTIGVDINPHAIDLAKHFLDKAMTANIETDDLGIEEESIDYILFADVLEHLHDPDMVLRKAHKLLKPNGKILASIPNTMNIFVINQLLHGNFTYQDSGLLDRTHIHLFTFNEIIRTFEANGYKVETVNDVQQVKTDEEKKLIDYLMKLNTGVGRFMYEAFQYQVRAVKVDKKE